MDSEKDTYYYCCGGNHSDFGWRFLFTILLYVTPTLVDTNPTVFQ